MTSATKLTKRCAVALLLLAFEKLPWTLVSSPGARPWQSRAAMPAHRPRKSNIDARVRILTKSLDLNDMQQSAVKNILEGATTANSSHPT